MATASNITDLRPATIDRAYAVIQDHVSAHARLRRFVSEHANPSTKAAYREIADTESDTWGAVCECEPQTVQGASALVKHIAKHSQKCGFGDEGHLTAFMSLAFALERMA